MSIDPKNLSILICTQYDPSTVEAVHRRFPGINLRVVTDDEGLLIALPDADILFLHREIAPGTSEKMGEIIAATKKLKWLQWGYTGVDRLRPFEYLWSRFLITTSKGMMAEEIADYVILVIQMLYRQFPKMMRHQINRIWERWLFENPRGKTLGVIGLGAIGKEVARKACFLGMKVIGLDVQPASLETVEELFPPSELKAFLGKSDVVALCVPLTPETNGLIGEKTLPWMKDGAYLINVSRGKIVDEDALVKAIKNGRLAGAALDVFFPEPLNPKSELWALDNVIITPHLSGANRDFPEKVLTLFCENLERFLEGREMINVVQTGNL